MNTRDLRPPGAVSWIARRLADAGFEAWAVGGAVRDAVLGDPPEDWDFATSARPGDVQRIFRRTVPVGVDHGTVGVLARDGRLYEVTTFRRDVETFGRRARVVFADTLEEDLERRDFTINAIAWNPLTGELRDPHGGAADLQRRLLRTVGNPAERFAEDRLRVLRALRFAGRYRMEIAADTWRELQASAQLLDHLSAERIREELYKMLDGLDAPSRALDLYERSGVLASLYPELQSCVGFPDPSGARQDLWRFQISVVDAVARGRTIVRLAALLHGIGLPVAEAADEDLQDDGVPANAAAALAWGVMRRLKASNADSDGVVHLVAQHASLPGSHADDAALRRWLSRVGVAHHRDLLRLALAMAAVRGGPEPGEVRHLIRRVRSILAGRPPLVLADLAIGGSDLRAAGIPPGPRYGEILRELLDKVIEDPAMNTREVLLREVTGGR